MVKIRSIWTGEILEAEWRTDHAASRYGQAVLVLKKNGQAVDLFCFQIIQEASEKNDGHSQRA